MQVDHLYRQVERWYEIGFDGDVADAVQRIQPAAVVTDVPTCTILWSRGTRPDELDTLLDTLSGLGITPREVHESAGGLHQRRGPASRSATTIEAGDDSALYCEIRVRGSLGDTLLGYLGWSHRVAKTTVVKVRTSYDELRTVLVAMASVTRVEYVLAL